MSSRLEGKAFINSMREGEGILNQAVREGRFSDSVLGAWALTELQMNGIFQLAMGIVDPEHDKRIGIVLGYNLQFGQKLNFAKETETITSDEYEKINRFNNFRNELLHVKRKGKPAWFFTITEEEKKEVIESAWEAAHASMTAMIRLIEHFRGRMGFPSEVNTEKSEP